ncbi:MAG: hypothetical protein WCJ29_04740 [bacterium]
MPFAKKAKVGFLQQEVTHHHVILSAAGLAAVLILIGGAANAQTGKGTPATTTKPAVADTSNSTLLASLQRIETKLTALESSVRTTCGRTSSTTPATVPASCSLLQVTGFNVGTGVMVANNEIGTFSVRNNNLDRSTTVKKITFEVSGNYDAAHGFGPKNFMIDRADPVIGYRISNTLLNGMALAGPKLESGSCANNTNCVPGLMLPQGAVPVSGSVLSFDLAAAGLVEEISNATNKGYVILADTTGVKDISLGNTTATTLVRMKTVAASYLDLMSNSTCDATSSTLVTGKTLSY